MGSMRPNQTLIDNFPKDTTKKCIWPKWITAIYEQHKHGVTVKHADRSNMFAAWVCHVPTEKDRATNIQNAYIVLRAERSDTYFQYLFFLRSFFHPSNIEDS